MKQADPSGLVWMSGDVEIDNSDPKHPYMLRAHQWTLDPKTNKVTLLKDILFSTGTVMPEYVNSPPRRRLPGSRGEPYYVFPFPNAQDLFGVIGWVEGDRVNIQGSYPNLNPEFQVIRDQTLWSSFRVGDYRSATWVIAYAAPQVRRRARQYEGLLDRAIPCPAERHRPDDGAIRRQTTARGDRLRPAAGGLRRGPKSRPQQGTGAVQPAVAVHVLRDSAWPRAIGGPRWPTRWPARTGIARWPYWTAVAAPTRTTS